MRRSIVLGCVFAVALAACAQHAGDELALRLQQLGTAADALESRLPAFTCRESLTSQELRGGKVRRQVQAAGDLRVLTLSNGKMDERFTVTEINGKPARPGQLRVPLFVTGGFRHALAMFREQDQGCFDFRLAGQRIDIKSRVPASEACSDKTDVTAMALLDETGGLTHLEFSIPPDVAEPRHAIPVGALDFSPADLGGKKFLLSTHVVATRPSGKSTYRFEANYTSCHLFQATVTLGDATVISEDPAR